MTGTRTIALASIVAGVAICTVGCGGGPVTLSVLGATDHDPFAPGRGATQARLTLRGDSVAPQSVPVDAHGAFALDVRPSSASVSCTLLVEALDASGNVLGSGETPYEQWSALASHTVVVFTQDRDSLVAAPAMLDVARAEPVVLAVGALGFAVLNVPAGDGTDRSGDLYDYASHSALNSLEQQVPHEFDGDTSVVTYASGWLLVRGASAAKYTNTTGPVDRAVNVPASRAPIVASRGLDDGVANGGWLVGGRDASGAPVATVDHVDAAGAFTAAPANLLVKRERPTVVLLRPATDSIAALWLVVGGQTAGNATMELYGPAAPDAARAIDGDATVFHRTGAVAVCTARDSGDVCTTVLLAGGSLANGAATTDDVLLDATCLRTRDAGCQSVLTRGAWLADRRTGARAVLAENGRVVVAGGRIGTMPAHDVVVIDVSHQPDGIAGHTVGTLAVSEPGVIGTSMGSVMLVGGRDDAGMPSRGVWSYRY